MSANVRKRPSCAVATALTGVLLAVAVPFWVVFHQSISDRLLLWQMHRAADRGEPLEPFVKQAAQHEDAVDFAARLSADPDPRVRREMIAVLVGDATPARKTERRFGAFSDAWTGMNTRAVPALKRLLADPDPDVRHQAMRTVSGLRAVGDFRDPLLNALRAGDPEDRAIVAESLAHWDADEFLKTFADPAQPAEVRRAVLRGADKYGWVQVTRPEERFQQALLRVIDEADPEFHNAAIDAARHGSARLAVELWLNVIARGRPGDRRQAVTTWIDAVANDEIFPGENYPILEETDGVAFGDVREAEAATVALVAHVLCAAARTNSQELDRAAPVNWQQALAERQRGGGPTAAAFVVELHRLQQILRAISYARGHARDYPKVRFSAWMPDEKGEGAPPSRSLKDYLLGEAREPLAWCRNHGGGYGSPFLRLNGFRYGLEDPGRSGQVRTLGQVLKDLRLDTDAALAAPLKPGNAP